MNKKITILTQKEKKELLTISNWLGLNADEFNRLEKKYIEILNESDGSTLYETIEKLLVNIVEELGLSDDEITEVLDILRDKVEEACERLPYEDVLGILHKTSMGLLEYYKKYKK